MPERFQSLGTRRGQLRGRVINSGGPDTSLVTLLIVARRNPVMGASTRVKDSLAEITVASLKSFPQIMHLQCPRDNHTSALLTLRWQTEAQLQESNEVIPKPGLI